MCPNSSKDLTARELWERAQKRDEEPQGTLDQYAESVRQEDERRRNPLFNFDINQITISTKKFILLSTLLIAIISTCAVTILMDTLIEKTAIPSKTESIISTPGPVSPAEREAKLFISPIHSTAAYTGKFEDASPIDFDWTINGSYPASTILSIYDPARIFPITPYFLVVDNGTGELTHHYTSRTCISCRAYDAQIISHPSASKAFQWVIEENGLYLINSTGGLIGKHANPLITGKAVAHRNSICYTTTESNIFEVNKETLEVTWYWKPTEHELTSENFDVVQIQLISDQFVYALLRNINGIVRINKETDSIDLSFGSMLFTNPVAFHIDDNYDFWVYDVLSSGEGKIIRLNSFGFVVWEYPTEESHERLGGSLQSDIKTTRNINELMITDPSNNRVLILNVQTKNLIFGLDAEGHSINGAYYTGR